MRTFIFILILIIPGLGKSQTFDDLLQNYLGSNKEFYIQPVADLMTGAFNCGWNSSGKLDSGLYFRVGIISMLGYVTDNLKTFDATTEYPFEPETRTKAATIVGSNKLVEVHGVNGTSYLFQGGLNLALLPLAVPQLSVGGLFYSEVSIRFFAYDFGGDFGRLQLYGFGARHDISHYLKMGDWFWNAGYAFQKVDGGNYFKLTSHLISSQAGKTTKHWYYYAILGYQYGGLDAHYIEDPDKGEREITVNLKNDFPLFAGIGGGVKAGILRMNLAVNYAKAPFGEFGIQLQF
jgi:hypothetical protein